MGGFRCLDVTDDAGYWYTYRMAGTDPSHARVELEITRLLESASNIDEVAPQILRVLCEVLAWDLGELWLLDADAKTFQRTAAWHAPAIDASILDAMTEGTTVRLGIGLPGSVFASGGIEWTTDIEADPRFVRKEALRRAGFISAVGFPLTDGRDMNGAVTLIRRERVEADGYLSATLNAVGRKIGEFVRLDRSLRRDGAHYRAIVENQADLVALIGLDGIIHYENAAVTAVLGYGRRERLGMDVYQFVHPNDVASLMDAFRTALDNPGKPLPTLVRVRHKDGSWRLIESVGRIMVDASGKPVALVSSRDITDRVRKRPASTETADRSAEVPAPLAIPPTDREIRILRLVAVGMTNNQIAEAIGISHYTVKDHLAAAMRKLDARNRVQAAAIATRRGLI